MTRITSSILARHTLSDIQAGQARLAKLQDKLSSGKELSRPSDDPAAVGRALQLRSNLAATQQYQRNAGEAEGWTDVTDSALAAIGESLRRVRDLTVQAANDASGPEGRVAVAEELKGLIDTIKTNANASYGGRYVFSGTASDVKPFELGASDAYAGNGADVLREIGPGVNVKINTTGADILAGPGKILDTLRTVLNHVQNGTGGQLSNDLDALDVQLDSLNAMRATVGATMNRVTIASDRLLETEGTTLKLLNNTESIDLAEVMIQYSTEKAAMDASLKAGANIVQTSLLDFLR